MTLEARPPLAALLPPLLLAGACASGGTGVVTRDTGTVEVVTGEGYAQEVRRGPEVLADQPIQASPDRVWSLLPEVFAALELEPDVRDSRARTLGVSAHRFSRTVLGRPASEYFDCGLDAGLGRPVADQSPVTAQVLTTVLASGDAAALRTVVQATARRTGGNAGVAVCRSTGQLENRLAELLRERAGTTQRPRPLLPS